LLRHSLAYICLIQDQWKEYDVLISPSDIEKGNKLASGNYGTVYEGKCRGQPVAIKVLHNQGLTKEKIEELKREVDIMRYKRFSNFYVC